MKQHMRHEDAFTHNLKSANALIYSQCSDMLRVKTKSRPNYKTLKRNANPIGLLETIKAVIFQFQVQHYAPLALHEAKKQYYMLYQDKHMTCQQYYETFKNSADVLEYCGGALGKEPGLVNAKVEAVRMDWWGLATDEELEAA